MGEIKSTLELAMERTRNMVLSDKERQEQALAEFRGHVNGLLQRFRDGVLSQEEFRRELDQLQSGSEPSYAKALMEEAAKRIDPDQDNAWAMNLLEHICGVPVDGLRSILDEYGERMVSAGEGRAARIVENLEGAGISGSAVVPNLSGDGEWLEVHTRLRQDFGRSLKEEFYRLQNLAGSS
jgi:hypothetical protein